MFCDITDIKLYAGNGGDGAISFRHEKYIARGGPNGGNGGRGGDVILKANENLNSLIELHTKKKFKAKNGTSGGGWQKDGANADDLVLDLPVGTTISSTRVGIKTPGST